MAEKTYKPTPRRLRDARKRGEVVKSRDLTSLGGLAALLIGLWFGAQYLGRHMVGIVDHAVLAAGTVHRPAAWSWLPEVHAMTAEVLWTLIPLSLISAGGAVLVAVLQTRGVFS